MMWKKLGERLHLTDKELEEERSHGLSNWMNEELGKIAKLDAIYKNHIQTISILTEKIPETKNMNKSTIEVRIRPKVFFENFPSIVLTWGCRLLCFRNRVHCTQFFSMNYRIISTLILLKFLKFDSFSDYQNFIPILIR